MTNDATLHIHDALTDDVLRACNHIDATHGFGEGRGHTLTVYVDTVMLDEALRQLQAAGIVYTVR